MHRRTIAVACGAALAMLAAPSAAPAATKSVTMGPPQKAAATFERDLHTEVNDFFPHGVTVHVGDRVRFVPTDFHTVNLPARGGGLVPFATPAGTAAGVNDAAGNPFWFNGQPTFGFNPLLLKPGFGKSFSYDGSQQVQSGLPVQRGAKPMTVTFSRTGSFTYLCDLHPGMKGTVRVVGRNRPVPSARADAAAVQRQIARAQTLARSLARTRPAAGTVDVGAAGPRGVEYFDFVPNTVTVPVGTTLTFAMTPRSFETHTATTGPGDPARQRTSYLGRLAASFEGPSGFAPEAVHPSDPPQSGVASLRPASHGNGFWNSGLIDYVRASPPPESSRVTFAEPGRYEFYCLVHPTMHGTVVVR